MNLLALVSSGRVRVLATPDAVHVTKGEKFPLTLLNRKSDRVVWEYRVVDVE